jgi:hypothetical protein
MEVADIKQAFENYMDRTPGYDLSDRVQGAAATLVSAIQSSSSLDQGAVCSLIQVVWDHEPRESERICLLPLMALAASRFFDQIEWSIRFDPSAQVRETAIRCAVMTRDLRYIAVIAFAMIGEKFASVRDTADEALETILEDQLESPFRSIEE